MAKLLDQKDMSQPLKLERFIVRNLHGRRTYDITIADNRLILVGENGSGKTTLISIIYNFISGQWKRLGGYAFDQIECMAQGEVIILKREELDAFNAEEDKLPPPLRSMIGLPADLQDRVMREYVHSGQLPYDSPRGAAREMNAAFKRFLNNQSSAESKLKQVRSIFSSQVLFLPTYRRIEHDLAKIAPDENPKRLVNHVRRLAKQSGSGFLELVEFGMNDVKSLIDREISQIKDRVASDLQKLISSHLTDIIENRYRQMVFQPMLLRDPLLIEKVLGGIDETVLTSSAKEKLRKIVQNFDIDESYSASREVPSMILVHFFVKLLELHGRREYLETRMRQFVSICNDYLVGKQLVYDDKNFNLSISLKSSDSSLHETVSMENLSSGEKQIVSLFSHLYLSGENRYFILIDEPELSLSIPWQRRFLVDIVQSEMCDGLIAVTHSPFIFDNALDLSTRMLSDFQR